MLNESDILNLTGLTEAEAASRLARDGPNELPSSRPASMLSIAFGVVREPMFLLLVAGGLTYFLLGDHQEATMLIGFVFAVMGITIYQERKTERALEALRDLSSPRALVIRDGERRRIAGREVVRGDILVMAEGDRVPADSVLLYGGSVSADESLLTGESVPVRKSPGDVTEIAPPGGDDLPFLYSGTLIVKGQGIAEVLATGADTELGKIGTALQTVQTEDTPLQLETRRLVKSLAIVGLSLSVFLVLAYGIARGHWTDALLAGITLAMAILPEEFPVVLTVFLALGAWRISRERVLTRRVPAVETLGAATILCVDKTGTLTENRMSVKMLFADGEFSDISGGLCPTEPFHHLVEYSILASQRDPFDPMERAIHHLGQACLADTEHIHGDWNLVREYALSPELLAMSHVWRSPTGDDYVIAAKVAPEAIFDLCHLPDAQIEALSEQVSTMANDGLRVLGVARSRFRLTDLPDQQHDLDFDFIGLIGLEDPVRAGVPDAVRECYDAGIRIMMITGDYPGTAASIARQIGLRECEGCITGDELGTLSDQELSSRIGGTSVFARVVPQQKLRIVEALKANGEIVAMTGDGVNDAPALKAANIGIAMGGRGTDVARESAGLVLLDDDFSSIVHAVRLGRRIFDNLKKAVSYIFSVHVPIIGMSLLPVLLGWPLILMPVHIAFLELIIDPACSIVFEAEPAEADIMRRPPRSPDERLFGRRVVIMSLLQGFTVLVIIAAIYAVGCCIIDEGFRHARAMAFTTLIISNLALIFSNRSWTQGGLNVLRSRNRALWWVVGGASVFLAMALYIPFLRGLFRFAPLSPGDIAVCIGAGIAAFTCFEILKKLLLRNGNPERLGNRHSERT